MAAVPANTSVELCLSNPGNSVVKVKVEGTGTFRKKKIGYAAPVFAEPPTLFPSTLSRGYNRKEFSEKYGLHHSGMSPKQLRDTDVTEAELVAFFGPIVNKNGHRYMFLKDEDLIQRIEHMWMVCHQKSVVLQSRLFTKAMAKGFYVQEVKKKKPNWALYAEWTNNEQLRRRLKLKSKAESLGEEFELSDGEDDGEFEDGGSTQSKLTAQEAGSRHAGIEVFSAPGGLFETITCWKSYSSIAHTQVVEAKQILEDAKIGKDEHMQNDLKARSQVDFCEMKLRTTQEKCVELHETLNALQQTVDNGLQVGGELASNIDALESLSRKLESQKSLVVAFEDCMDEANVQLLKVTSSEGFRCSVVFDAELRWMQADRHERAVKLLIGRLDLGTYLFRSVPPRPYADIVILDPPMQPVLKKCVACGLGFAPVWAVKLASCCHPYHEWCSRVHFESSKFCIADDCGAEMHEGWWVSTGLLKPGILAPLQSTVERFPMEHEGKITTEKLPVWQDVCPTFESGHDVEIRAAPAKALGAEIRVIPCKPPLQASNKTIMINTEMVHEEEFSEPILINVQDNVEGVNMNLVNVVSGIEDKGASGLDGAVTASHKGDNATQDVQMHSGRNPALKGLKSKNPTSTKKPIFATKLTPKILPMSAVLEEPKSTEEEGDEEEDGEEEDDESVDGEDGTETSEGAARPQKQKKKATAKRKAWKSKNGNQNQSKKMKVPISERMSTATNTRTAKKKSR